jgi:small redox-active disulfide protein 2
MRKIKVLGPGCPKCEHLLKQAEQALEQLGLECEIEKVTEINQITSYGVMMTPALVVDDEVKVVGKVPSIDELKRMFA